MFVNTTSRFLLCCKKRTDWAPSDTVCSIEPRQLELLSPFNSSNSIILSPNTIFLLFHLISRAVRVIPLHPERRLIVYFCLCGMFHKGHRAFVKDSGALRRLHSCLYTDPYLMHQIVVCVWNYVINGLCFQLFAPLSSPRHQHCMPARVCLCVCGSFVCKCKNSSACVDPESHQPLDKPPFAPPAFLFH